MPELKISLPTQFIFTTSLPVRITDINYGRHVGHVEFIGLLHEARIQFLYQHGFSEMDIEGRGIIMTNLQMQYKKQCFYGDVLYIQIGTGEISKLRCELIYLITNKDSSEEVARGSTTFAFFDYATNKLMTTPPFFIKFEQKNTN